MRSNERSTEGGPKVGAEHPRSRVGATAASCITLQERERVRIGFDLHDGPAQTMSAALLQVKMLQDVEGADLQTGLAELRATLAVALEEIYDLIENLGGRGSIGESLASRIRSCVDALKARSGIEAALSIEGEAGPLSPSLQIAVFRIVQEALSNVARHSGASRVDVRLRMSPSEVVCEITDDGTGFTVEGALKSNRSRDPYGLYSMRERAHLLDGECIIDSALGHGTRIRVKIPVWHA
jgi:signal transduction histidine kinase